MSETWKSIPGWRGFYDASSHGRIRGRARIVMRCNGCKKTVKARIRAQRLNRTTGYLQIDLMKPGEIKTYNVHCLIAMTFIGPKPKGKEVAHHDGIKTRNVVGNLSYKTRIENMEDRERHGVIRRGEAHGMAKLTESNVLAIRASTLSQDTLGAMYGISQTMISLVKRRKNWRHV